jgi:hypothetical protein
VESQFQVVDYSGKIFVVDQFLKFFPGRFDFELKLALELAQGHFDVLIVSLVEM